MSDEPRIDKIIARLEEEASPSSLDLGVEEIRIFRVLALLKGARGAKVRPEFAVELEEKLMEEIGIDSRVADSSRRKMWRGLIPALTAAVLIVTALTVTAGAFRFGRSKGEARAFWLGKSETTIAKEVGFGKLPIGVSGEGRVSPPGARRRYGYESIPMAPGAATMSMDWKIDYVWDAGTSKLPEKAKAYKNRPGAIDKRWAYEVAKGLGFTGQPRSIAISRPGTADEDYSYRFESWLSNDIQISLDISSNGFLFNRTLNLGELREKSGGGSAKRAPKEERSIEIAKAWLKDKNLLTPGAVEVKTQRRPSGDAWADQFVVVQFAYKLDELPIYRRHTPLTIEPYPLLEVELGPDGEVIRAQGQFVGALGSSLYPLRPVKEAFDEVAADQSGVVMLPPEAIERASMTRERTQKLTIKSVELSYERVYGRDNAVFFVPIYVFKGALEGVTGRFEGTVVTVPAVKGEHLANDGGRRSP